MTNLISNTKKKGLQLSQYQDAINLEIPFLVERHPLSLMEKEEVVDLLLKVLHKESVKLVGSKQMESYQMKRQLLRAILNTLPPYHLDKKHQKLINALLQAEVLEKEIQQIENIEVVDQIGHTKIGLWKGDITQLEIDAIVNAANSQMLGCFQPLHQCIDNAIHSAAGVQLRDDCQTIMSLQDDLEATGVAKITRGYNLPSKYVIHTVGPIVNTSLNATHQQLLSNCYTSCLEITRQMSSIKSLAFCCISTGVFGYPQEEAAQVAVQTVTDWLAKNEHNLETVVFNVFQEDDLTIYQKIFQK